MGPPGGGPEPATQRTTSYFWEKSPGQAQQGNLDVSQALEFAVTLAVIFSPCRVTQMPHCFIFSPKRAWTNVNKPCQVNFSFQHMNISISAAVKNESVSLCRPQALITAVSNNTTNTLTVVQGQTYELVFATRLV